MGCTPLADLSEYSAGASVSTAPDNPLLPGSGGGGNGSSGAVPDAGNSLGGGEGVRPTELDQPAPVPTSAPLADASTTEPNAPNATVARFVRLVADADVNLSPYSSAAELGVLDEAGVPLAAAGWIATADSAEAEFVGGAPAAFAIDGDPTTLWHTPWFEPEERTPHPHFLQIDLGTQTAIGGFSYLPRQDPSDDGSITEYRFFVSADGLEWGEPLAQGRFDESKTAHEVLLEP